MCVGEREREREREKVKKRGREIATRDPFSVQGKANLKLLTMNCELNAQKT